MDGREGSLIAEASTEPSLSFNDLPAEAIHLIFGFLAPKELCCTSAVCKAWRELNKDASANRVWKSHYAKRWIAPPPGDNENAWQMQYSQKVHLARAFSSKGLADLMYGHKGAISAISLLSAYNMLATGSDDNTVRLWNLRAGLPRACSPRLKMTIRALFLDEAMMACGGGQDGAIRVWRSQLNCGPPEFDLSIPTRLSGHTGPVMSLAGDRRNLYSGSWDCSVRIWSKATLRREALLAFPDWVHAAKPRGANLLVTAGQTLHVCDTTTGQVTAKHQHTALQGNIHWEALRPTNPLQVEGSQDGRVAFLAGSDGAVVALDLRSPKRPVAVLWDQNSAVKGLSYEDPWLAAATFSGSVLLMDIEALLKGGRGSDATPSRSGSFAGFQARGVRQRAVRQRFSVPKGPAHCVDIADSYLACGSGDAVVRTWEFQQPKTTAPQAEKSQRLKSARRQQPRFPITSIELPSSSDEEDVDEVETRAAAPIQSPKTMHLSQSLPAHLGGAQPAHQPLRFNPDCNISRVELGSPNKSPDSEEALPPSDTQSPSSETQRALAGEGQGKISMDSSDSDTMNSDAMKHMRHRTFAQDYKLHGEKVIKASHLGQHRSKVLLTVPLSCRREARRGLRGSIGN